jgi:rhamnose utilization protein RhaD (predicted bifunctional aldolase and dehydrogenase)
MADATTTAERREEIVGELAEWMHAAAREAQRRLLEAETTDDFAKLTACLDKLARGARRSTLLHRKLEAERIAAAQRAEETAARAQADPQFVPRHVKRVRIRTAITRHVWNELEGDEEAELFRDDLNARLDELEEADDFLEAPIDDLIATLCRDLGFDPPLAPATGPAQANAQIGSLAPSGAARPQRVGQAVLAPDSS